MKWRVGVLTRGDGEGRESEERGVKGGGRGENEGEGLEAGCQKHMLLTCTTQDMQSILL